MTRPEGAGKPGQERDHTKKEGTGKANAPGQQGPDSIQPAPGKSGEPGRGNSMENRAQKQADREAERAADAAAEQGDAGTPPVSPDPDAPV